MACPRSISFTIPGSSNTDNAAATPDLQVKVVELDGKLVFTLDVLDSANLTADLRGLFFDLNDRTKLPDLAVTSAVITDFDTVNVVDLGNGANMRGVHHAFDVGIEFGTQGIGRDDIQAATFTLSNAASNLTLDDVAHVTFGARLTSVGVPEGSRSDSAKLTAEAPAPPDAINDVYTIFEDGQADLSSPAAAASGVVFEVLSNDLDPDGGKLVITQVDGAEHGTLQIVDGADADTAAGDAVLYTPFDDYSGTDVFNYCIANPGGGIDSANVDVTVVAVADVPSITVDVLPGSAVNELRLVVSASQNDTDNSEYVDRIIPGSLPDGVTIVPAVADPGSTDGHLAQEFSLTLPPGEDANFDLTFTAVAKEISNGDEETAGEAVHIAYDYNTTTAGVQFTAEDQNIWASGDQFAFTDDRFLGIDTGHFDHSLGSAFYAGIEGEIKLGLQSTLTLEGGQIDATATYDVTVETSYNKTVDQLLIDTSAIVTDASFATEGPQGSYALDFVYRALLQAYAGVDIDFGSIDFGPLGVLDLGGISERLDAPAVDIGPGNVSILQVGSDTVGGTISLPAPLNAFSVHYDWPDIATNGTYPPNPVVASGSSNNFLELGLDLDTLVTQLLGFPVNPLDPPRLTLGPFFADLELLDVDVTGGLNFLQEFGLQLGELTGVLLFEDGSNQIFTIGDSLLINDASLKDSAGDGDGLVEFDFDVIPTAALSNETELGFNIGVDVNVLSVGLGYDVTIPNPFGDDVHIADSTTLGPLAAFGDTAPVGDVTVYSDTFAFNFQQQQVGFFA